MDAFWCILLSILVLSAFIKGQVRRKEEKASKIERAQSAERVYSRKTVKTQEDKDIEELRKQGYTDELIAVILPTINNDK